MSTRTGRKTTREIGLDGESGAIATIPMTIMTIFPHVETITVTSGGAVVMIDMMNTVSIIVIIHLAQNSY